MTSSRAPVDRDALKSRRHTPAAKLEPGAVESLFAGVNSESARAKYRALKALRRLSEDQPKLLYPHFDYFVGLLNHPNRIFQWQGALVLAQLAHVDKAHKFEPCFSKYFSPVRGPTMITAANVIRGGAEIALAKPALADRIAKEVLKVSAARYQTQECRNIAIGHAVVALGEFLHLLRDPGHVLGFVRRQLKNRRPATRRKAAQVLNRWERCRADE